MDKSIYIEKLKRAGIGEDQARAHASLLAAVPYIAG